MVVLWAGYPFSKDYNKPRGHFYALTDVRETLRTGAPKTAEDGPLPMACWSCKGPDVARVIDEKKTRRVTISEIMSVAFENREQNHLGMPLPAGRVRVNQAANDGTLEFIGEDLIKHTPRNETLNIKLGNAFDVVGERKQVNFTYNDDADFIEESFEISVRNRKKVPATVTVREYLYRWSNWTVTAKSTNFEKRDAQTIDFPVTIAADGEAKIAYTVRYSW